MKDISVPRFTHRGTTRLCYRRAAICAPLIFSLCVVYILFFAPIAFPSLSSDEAVGDLPVVDLPDCAARLFEADYERSRRETLPADREAAHLRGAGVDHVYIVHYTPLRLRRGNLSAMLRVHGVRGEWVVGFDKELLNATTDECFHRYDAARLGGKKAQRYAGGAQLPRQLGAAQRSVVAKHFSALYDAYRRNYDTILVLEDDVLLRAGFVRRLAEVMRATPRGYDVVFVGGCMRMHAWRRKMQTEMITPHVYRKESSRCAHAFVASQSGVRKFLRSLPLTEPIDFQMNVAMREEKMKVYWIEPWLAEQGQFGEVGCVTKADIKAPGGCRYSTHQFYTKSFDIKYANDADVQARWDNVPLFHSRR